MNALRRISYYKLFPKTFPRGTPFKIDSQALRKEYIQLQQQVHPDTGKLPAAGSGGADAATVSTAYKAMLDPLTRAEHLLQLKGIDTLGEGASLTDEDMLMNVMMIREEAEECEDPDKRAQLRAENEERIAASVAELEAAFDKDDLKAASKACIELSYWSKLRKSLDV